MYKIEIYNPYTQETFYLDGAFDTHDKADRMMFDCFGRAYNINGTFQRVVGASGNSYYIHPSEVAKCIISVVKSK